MRKIRISFVSIPLPPYDRKEIRMTNLDKVAVQYGLDFIRKFHSHPSLEGAADDIQKIENLREETFVMSETCVISLLGTRVSCKDETLTQDELDAYADLWANFGRRW